MSVTELESAFGKSNPSKQKRIRRSFLITQRTSLKTHKENKTFFPLILSGFHLLPQSAANLSFSSSERRVEFPSQHSFHTSILFSSSMAFSDDPLLYLRRSSIIPYYIYPHFIIILSPQIHNHKRLGIFQVTSRCLFLDKSLTRVLTILFRRDTLSLAWLHKTNDEK